MKMNESLFDNIIDTAQDCIFWKDKDRRFVGVNQAFLDFYGFESADVLIGKNDEDMGWHSDPEPFKQDELRVLAGESTYKVLGKCEVKGEERDIIATKRPIYHGGEVVGLVGSFVDVTDVIRREREKASTQTVYTIEKLREYPYFDKLLDEVRLDEVLDYLTGIISRAYIFDYVKSLISSRIPFTFCIVDLDNFKNINDTYGHHAGDIVLMDVSKELASFTEGYGLVGRFGGDELLVVNLRDIEYDDKVVFFKRLYEGNRVFRKNLTYEAHEVFVTATSGCATYPDDSKNYDELFALIDKTLYHGKKCGRNCYTIYMEEKHKDIEVKDIARSSVYSVMYALSKKVEREDGAPNKLKAALPVLEDELHITDVFFVDNDARMRSTDGMEVASDVDDIDNLIKDDQFTASSLDFVMNESPNLYDALNIHGICSVMIVRVSMSGTRFGHLICADMQNNRLWQDSERGIIFYLAKILAASLLRDSYEE